MRKSRFGERQSVKTVAGKQVVPGRKHYPNDSQIRCYMIQLRIVLPTVSRVTGRKGATPFAWLNYREEVQSALNPFYVAAGRQYWPSPRPYKSSSRAAGLLVPPRLGCKGR